MDIITSKRLLWLGDSYRSLMALPSPVRHEIGYELWNVQTRQPVSDSKPMPGIGSGVEEIRVWAESGTYRAIYIARLEEAVYVLHVFQKKTQKTAPRDIELARTRLKELLRMRR